LPESRPAARPGRRAIASPSLLSLAGLALFFVALRVKLVDAPLSRDEGVFAYAGWLLNQGLAPYVHAHESMPPMIFYTYALASWLDGAPWWTPRLLAYLAVAGATLVLGRITALGFGRSAGHVVMWLVTPLFLLPRLAHFPASPDVLLILPALLTVWMAVATRERSRPGHWFGAGVTAAVALWYKPTALPLLLYVFGVWSFETLRAPGGVRRWAGRAACTAAAMALVSALVTVWYLAKGAGQALWECVFVFMGHYAQATDPGAAPFSQIALYFGSSWPLMVALIPAFVLLRPPRWIYHLGLFGAAMASSFGSAYLHYYLIVMPFWALLAAASLDRLGEIPGRRLPFPAPVWKTALAAVVVGSLLVPGLDALRLPRSELHAAYPGRHYPFYEARLVANRVAELSGPDDRVFVAGSEPQILFYARRHSATRFIQAYMLTMDSPLVSAYQAETIADLERTAPKLVVMVQMPSSWLVGERTPPDLQRFLGRLLRERYRLVGGWVWGEVGGMWLEPLPVRELERATLVLYEREDPPRN
jgi:hypothetical protein